MFTSEEYLNHLNDFLRSAYFVSKTGCPKSYQIFSGLKENNWSDGYEFNLFS